MQIIGKAINAVRAEEVKQLKLGGYEPILKVARWLLLKRPENLTDKQAIKLSELLRYNLKSIRSHLMKEDFQQFWEYSAAGWAGKFLDQWCTLAMKSKIAICEKAKIRQAGFFPNQFLKEEFFHGWNGRRVVSFGGEAS
jgi:transposase